MGIKRLTPISQIEKYLKDQLKQKERALITLLSYVGDACIIEARTNGAYIDRTGNLRSSIGYVILKDGRVVTNGGFDKIKDGDLGVHEGESFVNGLINQYRSGITLIIVAGMNYSAAVEAKNINVLTSAELLAKKIVPEKLRELGFTIS